MRIRVMSVVMMACVSLVFLSPAHAQPPGQPFQALQAQIDALQVQLDALGGGGGGSPLVVVDTNGVEVGAMIGPNSVVTFIDGYWLLLGVESHGFFTRPFLNLFYTAPDCLDGSGPYVGGEELVRNADTLDGETAIIAGDPITFLNFESFRPLTVAGLGDCQNDSDFGNAGLAVEVDLGSLGVEAPFNVTR